MSGKIVLVTGGARSGKSTFAEKYVAKVGKNITYIATAQVFDEEMRYRVGLHKSRRPSNWKCIEAPYLAEFAIENSAKSSDIILFDCLTLYVTNLLLSENAPASIKERYHYVKEAVERIIEVSKKTGTNIVFVTNEVGMSIVPENNLAREFRDLAGIANQMIAAIADEVFLVISGIPVELNKIKNNIIVGE
ncbi:MAG: bifunctional adenosylcobinamide kinase/adenosylcobinamide-phosphate guanylyltransferase [Negativicutes bacterium]|nr:bifunctional adenosylcobinamide kinase/adenosylcobinamide-phosphate guanylyltransferase [Negativicutes bacterium]